VPCEPATSTKVGGSAAFEHKGGGVRRGEEKVEDLYLTLNKKKTRKKEGREKRKTNANQATNFSDKQIGKGKNAGR